MRTDRLGVGVSLSLSLGLGIRYPLPLQKRSARNVLWTNPGRTRDGGQVTNDHFGTLGA